MGILRVQNLSKSFGIAELFHDVSFDVLRGDKVGFVGANGTGKSTLMRCLMGLEEYDGGTVQLDAVDTIGYVEQEATLEAGTLHAELCRAFADVLALQEKMQLLEEQIADSPENAVEGLVKEYGSLTERFERLGGYDYESRIRRVAFGLGFGDEDFSKLTSEFSGGQQTRICLAKALLREPDFLFLDEPTNHLDIGMVEWLEDFLIGYGGGVLLISHDRFFLDRVSNKMLELSNKTVEVYKGNYSDFIKLKEERQAALASAYEKQQVHIKKTEEYIRKYKAGIKSKQARGREKQLNRLTRLVLPANSVAFNYFSFNPPSECAQRVAEFENVAIAYGENKIFESVSLLIRNGDGAALIGENGVGKTTLLKLLVGELSPAAGRVKLGSRVKVGYFSQQHEGLNLANTILDEIIYEYGITEEQARHYLGAFLFCGDDVYKIISSLSGGEKSRLAFLKLMLTGANFLVLDEPTNHLDIPAKEAVEEALMAFPGTFITVSHDRYFLDKVTNCTYELTRESLTEYNGNYSYYHDKKLAAAKAMAELDVAKPVKMASEQSAVKRPSGANGKKGKVLYLSPEERAKRIQQCEGEIAMLEIELKGIEFQMNSPEVHSDPQKSQVIAEVYAAKEAELSEKYDLWAKLSDDLG